MPVKKRLIEVVAPDPQWVTHFRVEAAVLQEVFGGQIVAIHHIGSTSVPDLPAKPVIDILLEVRDINAIDRFNDKMRSLGYEPRGTYGLPRRRYFPKIEAGRHTVHVHTWQTGDPEFERHISFRDYLIAHPQLCREYGRLKRRLAARFCDDVAGYMDGKHDFIQETERRAKTWRRAIQQEAIALDRLTLLPLNPAQLWHYLNRPSQLEAALHLRISRAVLDDPVPRAIRHKLRNTYDASHESILWNTYWLLITRDESFGAGLIGFKGAPGADGTAEIGYGIDPEVRGQGYMTEAAGALIAWALSQPDCLAVTADTEKTNIASIRVLEKLGFTMVREVDDEYRWIVAGPDRA